MRRPATLLLGFLFIGSAWAQEDKKTDDLKPADPDTGESTVEEPTLGLLPQPFERWGIKFAATYIGEALGNPSGGLKRGSVYEGRLNLAVDVDFEKLAGLRELTFHANMFRSTGAAFRAVRCWILWMSVASKRCRPPGCTKRGLSASGARTSHCAPGSSRPTPSS
jgi:carbohydrate-selective porin OprB